VLDYVISLRWGKDKGREGVKLKHTVIDRGREGVKLKHTVIDRGREGVKLNRKIKR
jgi:hypothetical protein